MKLEDKITSIITAAIEALHRPDLFREPLVSFSSASDKRYIELKSSIGEWHWLPSELLSSANSVISYFVPFTKEVAAAPKIAKQESFLWGESYAIINPYFTHINQLLCNYLLGENYETIAIPATHNYNPIDMKAKWSHRSAAVIAGLGAYGANRMVITAKGSAGRFCTVITAAKLKAAEHNPLDHCLYTKNGSCQLCFASCPLKVLHADSFDKFACEAETTKNKELLAVNHNLANGETCGKCISVCPYAYID